MEFPNFCVLLHQQTNKQIEIMTDYNFLVDPETIKTTTIYAIRLTPQQAEEVYYAMKHYITSEADVRFLSDLNEAQESLFEAELHVIKELTKNF